MNAPTEAPVTDKAKERAALTSRELRRRRLRRIAVVSSLCVGLPTLSAAIYYGVMASPQYESVAVVTVEGEPAPVPTNHKTPRDLDLVRQHMLSRAALDELDRAHGLVAHYQGGGDWLSRLDGDAGSEEIYDYYRDKVRVSHDPDAAAVTMRVRAFSGAKAQELATGLVASTDRFLDQLSDQARRDVIEPAEHAVAAARARLAQARAAAATPSASGTDAAQLEQELAREQLAAAMRGVEEARIEATRRQRHLVVVAAPSLPDQASEPRPLWSITTVFVTAAALMGVLWLLIAAVREHSRF